MPAQSRQQRMERLVKELLRSPAPLTAKSVGGRVGISTRTVRDYVAALNQGLTDPLVISDQHEYALDQRVYRRVYASSGMTGGDTTPKGRLAALIRYLTHDDRIDVHEAAERFFVSVPTIEADLGRVRAIVRDEQLVLRREGDQVYLEGTERAKRRLLRTVLFSTDGGSPLEALLRARDAPDSAMARISEALTKALASSSLDLNEYVRGELLIHLAVAVERNRSNAQLHIQAPPGLYEDPALLHSVRMIIQEVEEAMNVRLGDDEERLLFSLLLTNSRRHGDPGTIDPLPEMMELTRDALRALTEQFGIKREDERFLPGLALHLQHLRERALLGKQLGSPVGLTLKREHPLLHEMALLFAHALSIRSGLKIEGGEVDYLALHLGTYFQSELESGPLVTVTLVSPGYGSLTHLLAESIETSLSGLARVGQTLTNVGHDGQEIIGELLVTTVPPPPDYNGPSVRITPFGSDADLAAIRRPCVMRGSGKAVSGGVAGFWV